MTRTARGMSLTSFSSTPSIFPSISTSLFLPAVVREDFFQDQLAFNNEIKIDSKEVASGSIYDIFTELEALGEGAFSTVYRVSDKKSGKEYALKRLDVNSLDTNSLKQEIDIQKRLDHPNIIKLYDVFFDENYYYLVMEYMPAAQELFERICNRGFYQETDAKKLAKQLLSAVAYMHQNGIIHQDLKPENLISSGDDDNEILKVTDFGLAKFCTSDGAIRDGGTAYYAAPELLLPKEDGKINQKVDIWSCGVIIYTLLAGIGPFESVDHLLELVSDPDEEIFYSFEDDVWYDISGAAKDLITKMLIRDPEKRLTVEECLLHQWFKVPNRKPLSAVTPRHINLSRLKGSLLQISRSSIMGSQLMGSRLNMLQPSTVYERYVEDDYYIKKTLSDKGRFIVEEGVALPLKTMKVVVKTMMFDTLFELVDDPSLQEEGPRREWLSKQVQMIEKLKHPALHRLIRCYIDPDSVHLVQEHINNAQTLRDVAERRGLGEIEAKVFFKQLLDAIVYLHSNNVIHANLHPENVLVRSHPDGSEHLVISHYRLEKETLVKKFNYDILFRAPELWTNPIASSKKADIWSLGTLLFTMLCGEGPFEEAVSLEDLKTRLDTLNYNFDLPKWNDFSVEVRDLITRLLETESTRYTIAQCKGSAWSQGNILPHYKKIIATLSVYIHFDEFRASLRDRWITITEKYNIQEDDIDEEIEMENNIEEIEETESVIESSLSKEESKNPTKPLAKRAYAEEFLTSAVDICWSSFSKDLDAYFLHPQRKKIAISQLYTYLAPLGSFKNFESWLENIPSNRPRESRSRPSPLLNYKNLSKSAGQVYTLPRSPTTPRSSLRLSLSNLFSPVTRSASLQNFPVKN